MIQEEQDKKEIRNFIEGYYLESSGETTDFSTGAKRDSTENKPPMHLLPFDLMIRVANLMGKGAKKYGANNWRKGQSVLHCIGSIIRHLTKYIIGDRKEDHMAAIIFNAFSIMNVEEYHKGSAVDDLDKSWKDGKPTGE